MRKQFLLIGFFIFIPSQLFAEYNINKLADKVGPYLAANISMQIYGESRCGYALKKEYNFEDAVKEALSAMSDEDQIGFSRYIKSNDFMKNFKDERYRLEGFLKTSSDDGIDTNTACGIILSKYADFYVKAKMEWDEAVNLYSE